LGRFTIRFDNSSLTEWTERSAIVLLLYFGVTWIANVAWFLGVVENHVAWFHRWATQQLVAGERGIASFSTSLVRRGLRVIARAT
jgi:hypothetical protein